MCVHNVQHRYIENIKRRILIHFEVINSISSNNYTIIITLFFPNFDYFRGGILGRHRYYCSDDGTKHTYLYDSMIYGRRRHPLL